MSWVVLKRLVLENFTNAWTQSDSRMRGDPQVRFGRAARGNGPVETSAPRPGPTTKGTGFGWFPSRVFAINAAWLQLALTAVDLLAWTQLLLLDGALATRRTQEAALPTPARRRQNHPQCPANLTPYHRNLALGNDH